VLEAHARAYRRTWRASAASTFLTPLLYLAAMGIGLGSLVDAGPRAGALAGLSYLAWLTPGLLAASAMQTGFGDSAWPVLASLKWRRTYQAVLATPLGVEDIVAGHLAWVAVRVGMTVCAFALAGVLFGALSIGGALAAVAPGILTGLAFAAPALAFTVGLTRDVALSSAMCFGIVPTFLFSGTFFPIGELPPGIRWIAYASPLWHGVEVTRAVSLGLPSTLPAVAHVGVLLGLIATGALVARRRLRRRLSP
jgi:lipooligosaccharide transport system permease protein